MPPLSDTTPKKKSPLRNKTTTHAKKKSSRFTHNQIGQAPTIYKRNLGRVQWEVVMVKVAGKKKCWRGWVGHPKKYQAKSNALKRKDI